MMQFSGVLGKSRHVLMRSRSERLMQSFYSKFFKGNLNPPSSTLGRFCNLSCTISFNRFLREDGVAALGT